MKSVPVPSAATLSLAGLEKTELSDALFRAEVAIAQADNCCKWLVKYLT